MQYGAAIVAGVAASAIFWLIDKYLVGIPDAYRIAGMLGCFALFAGVGYWMASRDPGQPGVRRATRILSRIRAANITAKVRGVTAPSGGDIEILSNVRAKGNIKADVSDINTKP